MADRPLKIADQNAFAEEDPFAELTRIMGFDPREPVAPAQAARQQASARVEPSLDDDFSIDLEKELLGEFAADDFSVEHEVRNPAAYAPAVEDDFANAVAASIEQDFVLEDELDAFEPEMRYVAEPVQAATIESDFDDAVAASFAQDFALEDELDPYEREVQQFVEPVRAVAVEPEFDAAFDAALADVNMDFAAPEQDFAREDELDPYAREVQPVVEPVQAAAVETGFEAAFDTALADVDMDFAAPAQDFARYDEQPAAALENNDFSLSAPDFAGEIEPEAPVARVGADDEFERRLCEALVDDEPVYAAAPEPAPLPVVAPEQTLEDELNALLGIMSSQTTAAVAPIVEAVQPAPVVEAAQPVADPVFDLSSELDWGLDQHDDRPLEAEAQPETYATYADEPAYSDAVSSEYAASDDVAYAPASDTGYAPVQQSEPVYAAAAEDDAVEFDDEAFDLAFARSSGMDLQAETPASAQNYAPAPVPGPTGLSADRAERARSWGLGTPVLPGFRSQPAAERAAPVFAEQPAVAVTATYAAPAVADYYAAPAAREQWAEPAAELEDNLEAELFAAVSSYDAPDIETVDVPERAVALADDLDIPELSFEDDAPSAAAYDDLDGEFTSLVNEMSASESSAKTDASGYLTNPYQSDYDRRSEREAEASRQYEPAQPIDVPLAAAATAAAMGMGADRQNYDAASDDRASGYDLGNHSDGRTTASRNQAAADEFDFDPDLDEEMAIPGLAGSGAESRAPRRTTLIAAVVGAVAIVGGLGAFALSFGGGDSAGTPVVIKADDSPIKVKPENPGGTTVPNQDSKVYDRVAGSPANGAPTQEKLVTNTEEPVDMTAEETDAQIGQMVGVDDSEAIAPTAKSEDRIDQVLQQDNGGANADTIAVAPRKVRTMVVRPDGTLVPREEPVQAAPQVAATEPADPTPQRVNDATGAVGAPAADAAPAFTPPLGEKTVAVAKPQAQSSNTPNQAPIAPQRPAEQPVNVVGEVKPDQVAAINPAAATTAAAGAWAMQIASQPSEAAAQSTYQDLARRYGGVLNGHEANIVKAEIAGKGTFWRVRVPAATRNEAVALCESYKAAGGNCFVSK